MTKYRNVTRTDQLQNTSALVTRAVRTDAQSAMSGSLDTRVYRGRRMLRNVCFLLGDSPTSEFYMPTFRNTLSLSASYPPMKVEQTGCSETSAYKIQTPGNYPEESIQHSVHGENLKSRMLRNVSRCTKKLARCSKTHRFLDFARAFKCCLAQILCCQSTCNWYISN